MKTTKICHSPFHPLMKPYEKCLIMPVYTHPSLFTTAGSCLQNVISLHFIFISVSMGAFYPIYDAKERRKKKKSSPVVVEESGRIGDYCSVLFGIVRCIVTVCGQKGDDEKYCYYRSYELFPMNVKNIATIGVMDCLCEC